MQITLSQKRGWRSEGGSEFRFPPHFGKGERGQIQWKFKLQMGAATRFLAEVGSG
jgi:hypothetical protein